jgi:hypothetical protein
MEPYEYYELLLTDNLHRRELQQLHDDTQQPEDDARSWAPRRSRPRLGALQGRIRRFRFSLRH